MSTATGSLQAALHRVALSLDALIVNGTQFGLLHPVPGFLDKVAGILVADLGRLEASVGDEAEVAALSAACSRALQRMKGLEGFRRQSWFDILASVAALIEERAAFMRLVREIEERLGIVQPFHLARSAHSAEAVDAFLTTLDKAFAEEWTLANDRDAA